MRWGGGGGGYLRKFKVKDEVIVSITLILIKINYKMLCGIVRITFGHKHHSYCLPEGQPQKLVFFALHVCLS